MTQLLCSCGLGDLSLEGREDADSALCECLHLLAVVGIRAETN